LLANLKILFNGLIYSYSQIFFSRRRWFAVLILLASFVDPVTGMAGMLAVMIANVFAMLAGYNRNTIHDGVYAYNSLLVGLGIGLNFDPNISFFLILFFASILSFLFTVWMLGRFSLWQIPIGSLCFVIVSWVIILGTRNFNHLEISQRGIFISNEIWKIGGLQLVNIYDWLSKYPVHPIVELYLKSMGAVIFESNMLSGLMIAIGLLIYSRIAFSLSILGYLSGYFFYQIIGGSMTELEYGYIGFNFILTSIAIGGFFLIPSASSYLLIVILTPLNAILIAASIKLLEIWQLPVLSLPFNIILLLSLYALKLRTTSKYLQAVTIQRFSPENNLYHYKNSLNRFSKNTYYHISLPFFGEWNVSQGYEGKLTHKGEWAHALDFDIVDEEGHTFRMPAAKNEDFFCFKLPVIAPCDGWIEEVVDHIEDNNIGEVNLNNTNNWGNTVVIKHAQGFYSKLSHLMQYSILYPKGTFVKKGDIIAYCGSSGRSPEPHLHFQLQTTPYIGSRTLKFPLSYYISREGEMHHFKSFEVPSEGEKVSNISQSQVLKNAYGFILGSEYFFNYEINGESLQSKWEVMVDMYNSMYLHCHNTNSNAWFVNDGTLFYFTTFEGNRKSLLYYFYLGSYKVLQSFYKGLSLHDEYPLSLYNDINLQWLDDIISPFYFIKKAKFEMQYVFTDDEIDAKEISLRSSAILYAGKYRLRELNFQIEIINNEIESFTVIKSGEKWIEAKLLKTPSDNT
jgi:urea transporter